MQGVTDTPPEIAEMVRARLMALSGAERFIMGVRMFEAARRMALASLPADLPEFERKRLLFERFYGMPLPTPKSMEEDAGEQPNYLAEQGAEVYAKA